MASDDWTKVCVASELTQDMPMAVSWEGVAVCIYRIGEKVFATADTCSHGNASLADGDIIGYEIECPFHQGRFDVRTGAATLLPCRLSIATFNALEKDGAIWLQNKNDDAPNKVSTTDAQASSPISEER
ncbi:non-heme iron oxygenase ferredoxin subunit [Paraburkholderia caribensis]|uniref:non-heme iron oxygenase ferredoxin subunit n=1 Tax=Paraburkholderia caribensis TaxID=75105 RepID=UPI001CAC3520|nr:non-heme iron oxygenase ferredoxin subunit [Paraburkholderia caribensis]CAG9263092.1 Ferredoxin subunit of nitrite reductase and ring-hydroxylating dioxygenase [Paraburkholderia caribensis]